MRVTMKVTRWVSRYLRQRRPASLRLLIVDDDPGKLATIEHYLERDLAWCETSTAETVDRAIEVIISRPMPDLIVVDRCMRQGDHPALPRTSDDGGIQLIDWVRAQPPPVGRLPVVLYSMLKPTMSSYKAAFSRHNVYFIELRDLRSFLDHLVAVVQRILQDARHAEEDVYEVDIEDDVDYH